MNRKYSLEFENLATLKTEAKNPHTKLNKDGITVEYCFKSHRFGSLSIAFRI